VLAEVYRCEHPHGQGRIDAVPELPEVEALAADLRERGVGRVIERADVAEFSVLKTYDPPLAALAGELHDDGGVLDALHRSGASVIGIPADDGVDPGCLDHILRTHRPALVYLIPTHHNPTGLIMPADARDRIVRLAAAYPDTLFVDDMTLSELTLTKAAPLAPALVPAPLATAKSAIVVSSVSPERWEITEL